MPRSIGSVPHFIGSSSDAPAAGNNDMPPGIGAGSYDNTGLSSQHGTEDNSALIAQEGRMHVPQNTPSVIAPTPAMGITELGHSPNQGAAYSDEMGIHKSPMRGGMIGDVYRANEADSKERIEGVAHAKAVESGGTQAEDIAFNRGAGDVGKNMAAKGLKLPDNYAKPVEPTEK